MRAVAGSIGLLLAFLAGWQTSSWRANLGAPEDIGSAFEEVLRDGSRVSRLSRLTFLMEQLDATNLEAVLRIFERELPGLDELEIRPVVEAWSRIDAAGALRRTIGWPLRSRREIGSKAAVYSWAMQNPLEARLAIEELAKDRKRLGEMLLQPLVRGWVHSDQGGLQEYLQSFGAGADGLIGVVVGESYRRRGVEGLLPWVDDLIEGYEHAMQEKVFRTAVRVAGLRQPERTADWVLEHYDKEYGKAGPRILGEAWVRSSPQSGFEWIRDEAPVESRPLAVEFAFGQWFFDEPEAAREWLRSAPRSAFYDPALRAMAGNLSRRKDPRAAVEWCERAASPQSHQDCVLVVAGNWRRLNPIEAEEWLQNAGFDENTVRAIRDFWTRREVKKKRK